MITELEPIEEDVEEEEDECDKGNCLSCPNYITCCHREMN